jgi:hypothetical protein
MMNRLFVTLALVLASALPAGAQQLKLDIKDGRVTLEATSVPVRQILTEWARIGGTKVIGGDKVAGAPMTLKLVNVTEQQALDILLRNVAGFMAAPRLASAAPGASRFDRILIMATSSAAPSVASRPNAPGNNLGAPGGPMNGTQRRVMPPRPPNLAPSQAETEPDEQPEPDQADTGVSQQPVFTFPAPPGSVTPGGNNPVFVPMNTPGQMPGQPGSNTPVITLQPGPNGPTIYNFVPNTGTTPAPANGPYSVIGSPTPGLIQAPPAPAGPPVRPPGR